MLEMLTAFDNDKFDIFSLCAWQTPPPVFQIQDYESAC